MREGHNPYYAPPEEPTVEDPLGYDPRHAGPPRVRFSRIELQHLAIAVVILTFCVGAVVHDRGGFARPVLSIPLAGDELVLVPTWPELFAAFLAVASGFILHELAHKVLAQRYGHWAEFRARIGGLFVSYALATLGFLLAAPGAVHIQGRVTMRENGLISLVGPGMNMVIAVATWPLAWSVNPDKLVPFVAGIVAFANAFLCVFNLLPFGPLDGRKVLAWSKAVYIPVAIAAVGLLVLIGVYRNGPPF